MRSTSPWSKAASPPSSARTAPARPRCSTSSPAFRRRTKDGSSSRARTSPGSPPERIAAHGLVRTFQLVQLFRDLTAVENVKVGCHLQTRGGVVTALVRPKSARQAEAQVEATARELLGFVGLEAYGDLPASALTYGQQRLLEIARALAAKPKLLLLDEPAAGLELAGITGCCRRPSARSSRKARPCC